MHIGICAIVTDELHPGVLRRKRRYISHIINTNANILVTCLIFIVHVIRVLRRAGGVSKMQIT